MAEYAAHIAVIALPLVPDDVLPSHAIAMWRGLQSGTLGKERVTGAGTSGEHYVFPADAVIKLAACRSEAGGHLRDIEASVCSMPGVKSVRSKEGKVYLDGQGHGEGSMAGCSCSRLLPSGLLRPSRPSHGWVVTVGCALLCRSLPLLPPLPAPCSGGRGRRHSHGELTLSIHPLRQLAGDGTDDIAHFPLSHPTNSPHPSAPPPPPPIHPLCRHPRPQARRGVR
jgi:hypothetical protein